MRRGRKALRKRILSNGGASDNVVVMGMFGGTGSGRRARRAVVIAAVAILAALGASPVTLAAKKRHRPPTPAQQYAQARTQLSHISKSAFNKGRRAALLRVAAQGARTVKSRQRCRALGAIDRLLNATGTPSTWKRGRIPKGGRAAIGVLTKAETAQLKLAGRKCARASKPTRIRGKRGGSGAPKTAPPPVSPEQGEGFNPELPTGPLRVPHSIGPGSGLGADPHGNGLPGSHDKRATAAADPLTFFRISDVGIPPRTASPMEPTVAIGGHVVWYTGNTSVGLSTNDGRTFTLFDPSNVLPDQGLAFCCDQLVSYDAPDNMFVWVSQYWCNEPGGSCFGKDAKGNNVCQTNGAFNRIRIAVASPQDLIRNASNPGLAWTYWDITPSTVGQPSNAWFDRSDLSLNAWNMDWTVDVLCGTGGSVLGRISLSDLRKRGTVNLGYYAPGGRWSAAQGTGTTTSYFVENTSTSHSQIWSWAPFSGTAFPHDIDHSSIPTNNSSINGSDGSDWYDRYGIFPGEVESSTLSGNTLYVAQGTGRDLCTDKCGAGQTPVLKHMFDQPAVLITKFDVNTWKEVGERWLWNGTLGFGWPALQTDGAGEVGIALRTSAANHNPQPVAGFLTPDEQFVYALPEGQPHETGDYYSLRPGRTSRSFIMAGQTVQKDPGGTNMHWYSIEYGHGATPYVAPPSVHITAPPNLTSYTQGDTATYGASVSDPVDGTLPSAAIVWTEDGSFIGTGPVLSHVENTLGTHVVKVTGTNGDGKSASDTVTIRVNAKPSPLHVSITSPADQSGFGAPYSPDPTYYCHDVTLTTAVSGGVGPVTYTWTDSKDLGPVQQVSTQSSPTLHLCDGTSFNESSSHDLTVTVSDGTNTATASVRVYIISEHLG